MNKENQRSGNSGSRTQGGSHEQHVEAGRKGGEASRGGGRSSKSSSAENGSGKSGGGKSGSRSQSSMREQYAETGREGSGTSHGSGRSSKSSSPAESNSSGNKTQGGTREQRTEAGCKDGETSRSSEKRGSQEEDESRQRGSKSQSKAQKSGKGKTVKYKLNGHNQDKVNQIKPQLDQNDQIDSWYMDFDDTDVILTIVMSEAGDVAMIETILSDADCNYEPCFC